MIEPSPARLGEPIFGAGHPTLELVGRPAGSSDGASGCSTAGTPAGSLPPEGCRDEAVRRHRTAGAVSPCSSSDSFAR